MRAVTEPRSFLPGQDAVRILSTRFSKKPMLPLLRTLSWLFVPSERLQSCVPLIISPHLAHLRLHFEDNSPEYCIPILKILTKAAGSLKSVDITPDFDSAEMRDAVSELLLNCKPNLLREFRVASPISEAALLHAAQLPGLINFSLRGGTPAMTGPPPLTMFPSLRTLLLSAGDSPTWLELLRHIQSKQLTHLLIDFERGDTDTLPMLSTHIQHSGMYKTLTVLNLHPGDEWIINKISIAPLLALGELVSLTIYTACGDDHCLFLLSDKDIERLAKAMPNLVFLSLGAPCPAQMRNDLTVKSLLAIAKHCKHLRTLEMHVNCESIVMSAYEREDPVARYIPPTGPPDYDGCPLGLVTFGSCPIPMESEGGIIFAMTLLQLFPRLFEVQWNPPGLTPPWSSVNALIRDHNQVRSNLARFGKSAYGHHFDNALTIPQRISLRSSYAPLL